jgi:hypothetical protein
LGLNGLCMMNLQRCVFMLRYFWGEVPGHRRIVFSRFCRLLAVSAADQHNPYNERCAIDKRSASFYRLRRQ